MYLNVHYCVLFRVRVSLRIRISGKTARVLVLAGNIMKVLLLVLQFFFKIDIGIGIANTFFSIVNNPDY